MNRLSFPVGLGLVLALATARCGDDTTDTPIEVECRQAEDCPVPSDCIWMTCEGERGRCVEHVDCECACLGKCGHIELGGCECGGCECGEECIENTCSFTACADRHCGDDGCGGSCGDCAETESCEEGVCVSGHIWIARPDGGGDCTATDPYCSGIQAAIDAASDGDAIRIGPGTYIDPIDIDQREGLIFEPLAPGEVTIRPTNTVSWAIPDDPEYDDRQTAIRVVDSLDIEWRELIFDFEEIKGNDVSGILYWNSTGALADNLLKNMNVSDAEGVYRELTTYFRAPDFTDLDPAVVVLAGNVFVDPGRLGILTNDFVHAIIAGNTFEQTEDNFGYAIEIGSVSTALIIGNVISGFDTPAASDDSASAGILAHNSYTTEFTWLDKPVVIEANDVFENQYGVMIGNSYDGLGGDVDIDVELCSNQIHDNIEGGVMVVDEDRWAGSSVTLRSGCNCVIDNGGAGYFFYTLGDGEIIASLIGNLISHNDRGIVVQEWDDEELGRSRFDVHLDHNVIAGNSGHRGLFSGIFEGVTAENNWWGCNEGPFDDENHCDLVQGEVELGSHLVLRLSASANTIHTGETVDLFADLRFDCYGSNTSATGCIPDRLPIHFETTLGAFESEAESDYPTCDGLARTTLFAGDTPGIALITATFHHETVSVEVEIVEP